MVLVVVSQLLLGCQLTKVNDGEAMLETQVKLLCLVDHVRFPYLSQNYKLGQSESGEGLV